MTDPEQPIHTPPSDGVENPFHVTDDTPSATSDTATPNRRQRRAGRRRRLVGFGAAAALLVGIGAGGGALAEAQVQNRQTTSAFTPAGTGIGSSAGTDPAGGAQGAFGGPGGFAGGPAGSDGSAGPGTSGGPGTSDDSSASSGSGTAATAAQTVGVVTIDSTLKYEDAEAAGTGIVLTSSGEILTNNHVVDGSTSLKVTVESTGKTYTATVIGTDSTDDIAVLQLQGASDLRTATIASGDAAVGDTVTAVGNAGGTGTLTTAAGKVTDLEQAITTEAEGSAASEQLTGLIETDADIVSGDSGGPLTDSAGAVIGIDTAASSGSSDVTGYAIPITDAVTIAKQIVAGDDTDSITIGSPAFLGVAIATAGTSSTSGATIGQVIDGTPAASSGLETGDTITAVDGSSITSGDNLTTTLQKHSPGDTVTITYTDTDGASHTADVTLITGPAD